MSSSWPAAAPERPPGPAPVEPARGQTDSVGQAITRLDGWLETMRGEGGYSGPVAHWWESCWLYTGPMIDWRYEGIVCGYVELFRRGGDERWLARARRAGDDAAAALTPDGHFGNSSFQFGAQPGGTPHEAAVDVALLELARLLRELARPGWEPYAACAERNLDRYLLKRLWAGDGFADQPWHPVRVPNKNATAIEALLLAEEVLGRQVMDYVRPAAEVILRQQVTAAGPRRGATVHAGTGGHALAIGIYTARCACALLRLAQRTGERRYEDAAVAMGRFLADSVTARGTRFGFYRDGRPVAAPEWVSPSGDVLRALLRLSPSVEEAVPAAAALADVLVQAQLPTGGIPTAYGFAARGRTRRWTGEPEFRDVLPAVGWCDKALRALAMLASGQVVPAAGITPGEEAQVACRWRGRACSYHEDATAMELRDRHDGRVLYRWRKGRVSPDVYAL